MRVFPSQTGYQDRLYSLNDWPDTAAHEVEKLFFKPVDTAASDALNLLKAGIPKSKLDPRITDAWATFLLTLHLRMPEDLEILRSRWREKSTQIIQDMDEVRQREYLSKAPSERVREFERELFTMLVDLNRSELMRRTFIEMHWIVVDFTSVDETLYFSDRPIFRTAPLASRNGTMMMPIGPKHLFVAAIDLEVAKAISKANVRKNLRETNKLVVSQAQKYAYAIDDRPLRFMQNNLGTFRDVRPIAGSQ